MFEKEAEEYATTGYDKKLLTKEQITVLKCGRYDGFQKGAEFGYNKANEEYKEKCKTAYIKGIRTMANALKDYDRTNGAWTDYFEHTVEEVLNRLLLEHSTPYTPH